MISSSGDPHTSPDDPSTRHQVELPIALTWYGECPLITFGLVPTASLALPFWQDALDKRTRITRLEPLDRFELDDNDLAIAGAVHHTTRCGSTLIMRQFATLSRVTVLSEPFVFQHLLEGPPAPAHVTQRRIRQLAAAHRAGVAPLADKIVIKWPALCSRHAETLASALPEVPMVFLHRDPHDVLRSIAREPLGGRRHVLARHLPAGFDRTDETTPEAVLRLWAAVIATSCLALPARDLRSVYYADLPDATWTHIAPYYGFGLTPEEIARMRAVSRLYSKDPTARQIFHGAAAGDGSVSDRRIAEIASEYLIPALESVTRKIRPLAPPAAAS